MGGNRRGAAPEEIGAATGRAVAAERERAMRIRVRRLEPAPRIVESRECWGCGEPSGEANYCRKCAPEVRAMEIENLEQLYCASGGARATKANLAVFRARIFLHKWLWVPNLLFIGGVVVYLAAVYGYAFIEWLNMGGWQ
jgi:hypothetical protein